MLVREVLDKYLNSEIIAIDYFKGSNFSDCEEIEFNDFLYTMEAECYDVRDNRLQIIVDDLDYINFKNSADMTEQAINATYRERN